MTEERHSTAEQSQDDVAPDEEAAEVRRTPGSILAEHRRSRGLSVKEVANSLHLTMHFVDALESDSYEKLPGDVFVRGYIRSYAELLQLSPEEVLSAYHQYHERRNSRCEQVRERQARRRRDKNRPWIVVSTIAFIGFAVALWYFSPGSESEGASTAPPRQVPNETASDGSGPELGNPRSGPAAGLMEQSNGDTGSSSRSMAEPGPEPFDKSLSLQETGDRIGREKTQPDSDAGNGETVDKAEEPLRLDWQGEDELRIRVSDESWIEIEDGGRDNNVYGDLLNGGESLVVRGQAPFDVMLGNAPVARLQFNGRDIDVSANVRQDNSARLTIGL